MEYTVNRLLLRMVHVMHSRQLPDLKKHCAAKLLRAIVSDDPPSKNADAARSWWPLMLSLFIFLGRTSNWHIYRLNFRGIVSRINEYVWWTVVTNIVSPRGPYALPSKRGKTQETFRLALQLSPQGPPSFYAPWVVSSKDDPEPFARLLRRLFKRNSSILVLSDFPVGETMWLGLLTFF